jgi:hypothetical protein
VHYSDDLDNDYEIYEPCKVEAEKIRERKDNERTHATHYGITALAALQAAEDFIEAGKTVEVKSIIGKDSLDLT